MNVNVFPDGLLISAFRMHFVCILIAPLIATRTFSTHPPLCDQHNFDEEYKFCSSPFYCLLQPHVNSARLAV